MPTIFYNPLQNIILIEFFFEDFMSKKYVHFLEYSTKNSFNFLHQLLFFQAIFFFHFFRKFYTFVSIIVIQLTSCKFLQQLACTTNKPKEYRAKWYQREHGKEVGFCASNKNLVQSTHPWIKLQMQPLVRFKVYKLIIFLIKS